MNYVRKTYGVPVGRGIQVRPISGRFAGEHMIVISCSHHVHARHHFDQTVYRFHPLDLEYQTPNGWMRYDGDGRMT